MNSEHDRHDRVLVARYAAGDAYPSETDEAKDLVAGCDDCAALAADIRLISAKTAQLPAPSRTRDFQISPEQADQLRGSWFDRLMRGFSTPGWSVVRPVAAASLAIGMVLIVVGALPLSLSGGSSPEAVSGGQDHATTSFRSGVPAAASVAGIYPALAPSAAPQNAKGPSTPQPIPQPSAAASGGGVPAASSLDAVDSGSSMPAATAGSQPEVASSAAPPPPKVASAAPSLGAGTAQGYQAPSQPPADLGASTFGQAKVGTVTETSLDRSLVVLAGMILAFLALLALGLVLVARRRYSDPLLR